MTNEELILRSVGEIVERLVARFSAQASDHETKMAEHRAAFGARTEADAKIIAGLRSEIVAARMAVLERDSLMSERDGLLTQVQDMREEIIRVNEAHGRTKVEHDGLLDELAVQRDAFTANVERIRREWRELCEGRDALRAEVAALKSQTPKHPVKAGEWVKASNGAVAQVLEVHKDWYLISRGYGWTFANCEPCDPPAATHDTEAGKAVAESAVKTEPVAEEIKVGDVAKVVGASGDLTAQSDIGKIGEVLKIDFGDGTVLLSGAGWVNRCDVRKVTT